MDCAERCFIEMNIRNFLYEVDKIAGEMSKSELEAFVHENARLLPEGWRIDYLNTLKTFSQEIQPGEFAEDRCKLKASEDFEQEYLRLQKELCKIEEGELYIKSEYNYEYDEWYNNDDEEFIYIDPCGVGEIIEKACGYVHRCVDYEIYTYGYEIAKRLLALEIQTTQDEWDGYCDLISVEELKHQELISADYKQLVIDGLYLTYCANNMEDRAQALYRMVEDSRLKDIRLEMVMQNGRELKDIGDFLPVWIAYLGKIPTDYATNLLREAMELTGDPEVLLNNARRFYDLHPALYEQYLDFVWNIEDSKKIFAVGDEALEKIADQYVVRSRIAKRLSTLALEKQKRDKAEQYWLEAFRSETTVTNYMRLFLESRDNRVFADETWKICQRMGKKYKNDGQPYVSDSELKINRPGLETIYMLAFLNGEFQYVKEHAMNVSSVLGWSSTFMKCGIAAFLLLLFEDNGLREGGREMCRRVVSAVGFDKDEYQRWSGREDDLNSEEYFWECLKKWKEKVEICEEQKKGYLLWIETLIKKRVDGIMGANRRNYYGECASYIAALGEVLESRGQRGAKQKTLLEYKELYSRRRAFHEELRKYGMLDTRKRR